MPNSGIAESHGSFIFSFLKETAYSIVAVWIYIPTNSVGGFPFLHILSGIYCLQISSAIQGLLCLHANFKIFLF